MQLSERGSSRLSSNAAALRADLSRGPSTAVRLDPHALPHRFKFNTGLPGDASEAACMLDRGMAYVCRRLPSGLPLAMRMATSAFEGVAVRFTGGDAPGEIRIVLELLHRDPYLSLPLAVADTMDDMVADWRAWSKILSLPLLIVEVDGTITPVETRLGALTVKPIRPRRRRPVVGRQRPRFLARRQMGNVTAAPVIITGREITAWNDESDMDLFEIESPPTPARAVF